MNTTVANPHHVGHAPASAHGHGETMPSALGLPNFKLCMWLFLVSEVMFFAGLIGAYVVFRFGTSGWPDPYDVLAVRVTAFNTFLLICSSVTMVKAFQWSDYGNHRRALIYLGATIIGGATFVGIQVYEYQHLFMQPTQGLLHHVEEMMAERNIEVPGHGGHEDEHADAVDSTADREILTVSQDETADHGAALHMDEGHAAATDRQTALLVEAYERLHEGRPEVSGSGSSLLESEKRARAWDKEIMEEIIVPLAIEFPEDKSIIKYGRIHNQYPDGFRPGAAPGRDIFTSTFYIMTGFHGAHVAGGVITLTAIFFLYLAGRRSTVALEVSGLYWHFVDLVWIILFTIVYLM